MYYSKLVDDYSYAFRAISYYISNNCPCDSLKEMKEYHSNDKVSYVLANCVEFDLKNGMFIDLTTTTPPAQQGVQAAAKGAPQGGVSSMIKMCLKSKTKTAGEIKEFVELCIADYKKHVESINKNKIYHFIYKKKNDDRLDFSSTVISDLDDPNNMNFETFDHVFNEHKSTIIADMDRLNDVNYYRRNGIKRKKGYLFYGNTGCGKTYSVMAMANKSKRHIIEVPMSRVKTNDELEEIVNLTMINKVAFTKEEVIILFDEIDCGTDSLKKREGFEDAAPEEPEEPEEPVSKPVLPIGFILPEPKKEKSKSSFSSSDKLSLGTVLSRLDGIGSYNGILFIATTNCITSLDPAIYRHGRLDPYFFTHLRRIDMVGMIEKSFGATLSKKQTAKLPDRNRKISPSSLKKYIQDYENNLQGLLDFVCTL